MKALCPVLGISTSMSCVSVPFKAVCHEIDPALGNLALETDFVEIFEICVFSC